MPRYRPSAAVHFKASDARPSCVCGLHCLVEWPTANGMRSYKKKGPFRFNCYGPFKNSDNKKKTRKNGQIGTPIGSHQDAVKLNLVDVIQPVISRSTFAYCLFHLALANHLVVENSF